MNAEPMRAILNEHKATLHERYAVASLLLFGSVARGQATSTSDIDLLVEFNRPTGYFGLVALQEYLSAVLGRRVDLGTLRGLKPRVRERLQAEVCRVF